MGFKGEDQGQGGSGNSPHALAGASVPGEAGCFQAHAWRAASTCRWPQSKYRLSGLSVKNICSMACVAAGESRRAAHD